MQISRRFFTYPVLTNDPIVNSYVGKSIELAMEKDEDDNYVYLKNIEFSANSQYFKQLCDDGLAKVVCVIECPQTFFRFNFEINNEHKNISLAKNDLSGQVQVSLIAYMTKASNIKNESEFEEDYTNIEFLLDKYQIIAYDNGFSFNVNHSDDTDSVAKSIFSIVPVLENDDKQYLVEIKYNKIIISLSKDLHDKYRKVAAVDFFAEEFFCSLLIPALIDGLNKCLDIANKSDTENIDEISESYNWFNSVKDAYLRLEGKELTLQDFKNIPSIVLAQKVLGSPLESALDSIISRMKSEVNEDE